MRLKSLLAVTVAASALATSASAAVELVINGGFEEPPTPATGTFDRYFGGQAIPGGGWTVLGNDILLIDKLYTEDTLVFNANPVSNVAADLTGAGNTGLTNGVEQTIDTDLGQIYRLSFFVGNATTTGSFAPFYTLPSSLQLSINGNPYGGLLGTGVFTNSMVTVNGVSFQEFTTRFTGTGSDTIRFTSATIGDNYAGLDDVSVTAIPEPATWALMIMGFGGAGAMLRRRRGVAIVA